MSDEATRHEIWRLIYAAAINPGLQPSQVADEATDALLSLGLTRSEIRDEIDETIRNAYAEGWHEAKQRPDEEPPRLEIDWTRSGGVRITELWCVCEIDPARRLLLSPHHEINCLRYVNGPARPPDTVMALLRGEAIRMEVTTGFNETVARSQLQGIEYKSVKRKPVGP